MTRTAFEKRYGHLWLIRELDPAELLPSSFDTVAWDSSKTVPPDHSPRGSGGALAARLRVDPGHYGLYPVTKSGTNPWADRILIGRASNNDIVIRHESVSKLHAYFEMGKQGALRLFDAKSANGTRVDGKRIGAGGEGAEVRSGTTIRIGLVECELITSGDLYDAL